VLRLTEVLLFLAPFALAGIWLVAGRRLAALAWPALALAVVLAAMLITFGLRRSMPPGATYVPARLEAGHIVPGHAQ
jgi:hypothetical protein